MQQHELTASHEALARSNQDLEDFAHIASHDLKEPLRGLTSHAAFLLEDYNTKLDASGVRRLERIQYLTQHMGRLIDNLLSYSRLGRQDMDMKPTDLNETLREVVALMEATLEEQNAAISIPDLLPEFLCDRNQVVHVFLNLISNGVKYNNKGQKIIEVGYIPQMQVERVFIQDVFYVRDNGEGIEEQFYAEIFRIFKRLNPEGIEKKGSGIGLTITRKIIQRHGGQIWLKSEPGVGTTFYFTLAQGIAHDAAA
jgi:light-regulated signal transduction histidine kinase (bacteriophytochrome)